MNNVEKVKEKSEEEKLKESDIYIFGHKNPDTDSICSTLAYAHLKEKMGYMNVHACRLGNINKETNKLNYSNIKKNLKRIF